MIFGELGELGWGELGVRVTVMMMASTPDNERNYGVEDGGKRSRKFLADLPRRVT